MSKKMTIIIPTLNEPDNEAYNTVKNIYETADSNLFDIIVIDDCSDSKYRLNFNDFTGVRLIRNNKRIGVDECRQMGGELAATDNILILDSHMRFFNNSNWLNKMIECCEKEPTTLYCSVSLGLGYHVGMDLSKACGKYYAADLLFYDKTAPANRQSREILEPKWRSKEEKGEIYEVPIVLGAVYFMRRDRFHYLHGLKNLKMWGSSEVFLSLKNYLAGGVNKIHTGIEVGHRYRDNSPFVTEIRWLYYNKAYLCNTILPDDLSVKILGYLPKDINYKMAMEAITQNKTEIDKERQYYQSIFTRKIQDFCNRFGISL